MNVIDYLLFTGHFCIIAGIFCMRCSAKQRSYHLPCAMYFMSLYIMGGKSATYFTQRFHLPCYDRFCDWAVHWVLVHSHIHFISHKWPVSLTISFGRCSGTNTQVPGLRAHGNPCSAHCNQHHHFPVTITSVARYQHPNSPTKFCCCSVWTLLKGREDINRIYWCQACLHARHQLYWSSMQ